MIWVGHAVLTAGFVGAAAAALEAALRVAGRPGRWAWTASLVLSLVLFGVAVTGGLPFAWSVPADWGIRPLSAAAAGSAAETSVRPSPVAMLWAATTGVALLLIVAESLRVRLRARRWRQGRIGGMAVLVSDDVGPATLGLLRPRIVVPAWVFGLDARARRMIVLHEGEHGRAGDVRLHLLGALLVAVMPWNPSLWWQLSRLHRAIELDCDGRVVRRFGDRRAYGRVLLEAGARRSGVGPLLAAMAPRRTLLERRITALVAVPGRRSARLPLFAAAVALVAACVAPMPTAPDAAAVPATIGERPANLIRRVQPGGTYRFDSTGVAGTVQPNVGQARLRLREGGASELRERASPLSDTTVVVGQRRFGRLTRIPDSR